MMNLQNQQSIILEDGTKISQIITPVTIQQNKEDRSSNLGSFKSQDGKEGDVNIENDKSNLKQDGLGHNIEDVSLNVDYYQEHKKFLQNYKRQRSKKLKDHHHKTHKNTLPNMSEQLQMQEQQKSSQKVQLKRLNTQLIGQRIKNIHSKLKKQLTSSNEDQSKRRYKIFSDSVQNKKDIERISKQKRFIQSQQSCSYQYQEPKIHQTKVPYQYRVKTHSFEDEMSLKKKAANFIRKVHKQQQDIMGRKIMRKKIEDSKRYIEQKQQMKKIEEFNEIKRLERKLKAEQNLLLMRQKSKINHTINRGSLDQLSKVLEEKQKKIQQIRASLKLKQGSSQKNQDRRPIKFKINNRTSIRNDTSQGLKRQNDTKLNKVEVSSSKNEKDTQRGRRTRVSLKKYKYTQPTDYSTQEQQLPKKINQRQFRTQYVEMDDLTFGLQQIRKKQQQQDFDKQFV